MTTGTALAGPVFSAATSYYGVADLRSFAAETHDFESRYLDGLLGPLPGFEAVYAERAPVGHVNAETSPDPAAAGPGRPDRAARPVGVASPRTWPSTASGTPTSSFEGESHGFRKAETRMTALEAELSFYGQILGFTPPGVPQIEASRRGKPGR